MNNLHISCCDSACKYNSDSGYYGTCKNPVYKGTDMYGIDRVMVETCKLREKINERYDAVRACKTSNGYCIEFYPPDQEGPCTDGRMPEPPKEALRDSGEEEAHG